MGERHDIAQPVDIEPNPGRSLAKVTKPQGRCYVMYVIGQGLGRDQVGSCVEVWVHGIFRSFCFYLFRRNSAFAV